MNRCLLVLALAASCACSPPVAEAQPRCPSPEGALPAGVYWTGIGWYEESLSCPAPTVAVVEGVYRGEREAQRAVRGLPEVQFEPGFPWVVDARYAGLEADGVAVVLGWFEDVADARRWHAARGRGRAPTLVRVLPEAEALRRLPPSAVEAGEPEPSQVVWVPNGGTAYAFEDEFDDQGMVVRSRRTEACTVPRRSVFLFRERVWRPAEWHRWMPVRCGGQTRWIERTSTSEQAVSWVNHGGRAQVSQVTLVECDTPTHTTWEIDETGRRVHPVVAAGSCGGP